MQCQQYQIQNSKSEEDKSKWGGWEGSESVGWWITNNKSAPHITCSSVCTESRHSLVTLNSVQCRPYRRGCLSVHLSHPSFLCPSVPPSVHRPPRPRNPGNSDNLTPKVSTAHQKHSIFVVDVMIIVIDIVTDYSAVIRVKPLHS